MIGALSRSLSTPVCGVYLGLSRLGTTQHVKKTLDKSTRADVTANITTQHYDIYVIISQFVEK